MSTSLRVNKATPNVNSYVSEASTEDLDIFVEEDATSSSNSSSIIQEGWDAARKSAAKSNKGFTTDFRFDENVQLVKFISSSPLSFMQHWVNRPGKKSFVALGENDPLTEVGSVPSQKYAFTVLNLSDEDPQLQLMVVGSRLFNQLDKLASDKKTGPLNRPDIYFAVSKSGTGTKTIYSAIPVKERDLVDDWDIDPVAAAEMIKTLKPLGPEALHTSTRAELSEIAREIASAN